MDIDGLLTEHTNEIAALTRRLLEHISAAAKWDDQRVYAGWHGVGFHHPEFGYVVGIFPRATSVRVLFEHGHLLGDAPFVEGSGKTRYVDLTTWHAGRVAAVDDMLDRALAP
jgi:hypothetical protein